MLPGIIPVPFASVATKLSFLQGSMDISDLTTYTFASQNLGAADPNRWIVVCVGGAHSAARSISSVTVGGVSATKIVQAEGSTLYRHTSIWVAPVPTGTTGDIVVTWSGAIGRCGYSAYRLITGTAPTTAFNTQTDLSLTSSDLSVSINRPAGGVIVASTINISSTATSITWAGTTEDYDASWSEATYQGMSSSSTASGSSPVTVTATIAGTPTANNVGLAAASFQ